MNVTIEQAAKLLTDNDNIVILAHQKPDGDTLGSCFALLYALEAQGKTARVECADGYPERYTFLYGAYAPGEFTPGFIVAADVASVSQLGALAAKYPRVNLCIDHHKSNSLCAENTLVDASCPAATQIMYRVILAMGVTVDRKIADCLFTGLSTDTGCFRFANVNAGSHRLAAELIECGADHHGINKRMFYTKSRGRLEVEKLMMENLSFHLDGKCAVVCLPADLRERFDVLEEELDGIAAFARRVEGVLAGVTVRANADGTYRVSLRTDSPVDSSAICQNFGGGGHTGAGGCTMTGPLEIVVARLVEAVERELARVGMQ